MKRVYAATFAAATLLVGQHARADDDTADLQGLLDETVVTTASKSAETVTNAPATSSTITAEDLRRYGIHSLDEAIDFLSLGVVTSNPLRNVDIGARGVLLPNDHGNHFLVLVNGHSVNEPMVGAARTERGLGIPLEMVDHIEIVLGPGSVLYGSNAMLGVINIITKRAKDFSGGHLVLETEIAKSYRVMGGAGYEFSLLGDKSEATLGLEYYTQSGPAFTYGPQYDGIDPTSIMPYRYNRFGPGTGVWGGVASEGYYSQVPGAILRLISGDFEVNAHFKSYKRATPYRARYTSKYADFDDPDTFEVDRQIWVDIKHQARLSPIIAMTTRGYASGWDYKNQRDSSAAGVCFAAGVPSSVSTCEFVFALASRYGGIEQQTTFDWFKNESFVTLLGIDGRVREGRAKLDSLDFFTQKHVQSSIGIIDRNDKTLGAYLQQTWVPTTWLSLNGGARIDNATRFRGVISPRFAASIKPWKGGTLKGIYAEAFRAPSMVETDHYFPSQLRAVDLRPERVRSIEGSFEQKFGAQKVFFGVFRSWWTDLIQLHALSLQEQQEGVTNGTIALSTFANDQTRNVASIDNYGINAAYEGALGDTSQFRYGLNFTGSVARSVEPGKEATPLPVAPQAFGNARVSYDLPGELPTVALATHFMGKRAVDRAFDGDWLTIPYVSSQVEARVTVSGGIPWVKGLSYRASANALLNQRGPYVVGPGQLRDPNHSRPELVPADRFRATVGLSYDL